MCILAHCLGTFALLHLFQTLFSALRHRIAHEISHQRVVRDYVASRPENRGADIDQVLKQYADGTRPLDTTAIVAFSRLHPLAAVVIQYGDAPQTYCEFLGGRPVIEWIGPHRGQYDPVMFASVIASVVRRDRRLAVCIRFQHDHYDAITYDLQAADARPQPLPVPEQAPRPISNQM